MDEEGVEEPSWVVFAGEAVVGKQVEGWYHQQESP